MECVLLDRRGEDDNIINVHAHILQVTKNGWHYPLELAGQSLEAKRSPPEPVLDTLSGERQNISMGRVRVELMEGTLQIE